MATIRKLTTGTWQAIIRRKGHPPKSQTFPTRKDAAEWARRIEGDIAHGRSHGPAHAHRLNELITEYTAGPLQRQRAKKDRARLIGVWRDALGDCLLAEITPDRIAAVLRAYAERPIEQRIRRAGKVTTERRKRSSQSVRHLHTTLSALLEFGRLDLHWLADNPARSTRRAAAAPARIRWLTDEQRAALLQACRESQNPDLYLVVLLALTSGARQAEILNLRWSQIDWAQRCAWLDAEATKTAEPRAMPLTAAVIEELRKRPRPLRIDHVFASPTKRGQPRNCRQAWAVARKRAGLADFRFHDLRHSAATELLRAGVDSRVVAAVLGHKTMAMMKRYAHVTPALVVDAADRAAKHRDRA